MKGQEMLKYDDIPMIDEDSPVDLLLEIFSDLNIPGVFEFAIQDNLLVLKSVNDEIRSYDINFPKSMFTENTSFPKFLFCTGHINPMEQEQYLNHWELMYLLLESRLKELAKYTRVYSGLIQKDITAVNNYVIYSKGNAHNSIVKNENVVVLLFPYLTTSSMLTYADVGPIGDWLFEQSVYEYAMKAQLETMELIPGSETMLSESHKVLVYNPENTFMAPGYEEILFPNGKVWGFKSIFPPKQNLPARWKTHLHGEAFSYINADKSFFIQDTYINEEGERVTKDNTLRNMIVLFEEIDKETYRFGAGEIEVSEEFGKEVLFMSKHRELQLDEVFIRKGTIYDSVKGRIKIGMHNEELRTIDNVDSIKVLDIQETGFNNSYRIEYIAYSKASNSRITSQTGLKGVTKVMKDLGHISYGNEKLELTATCSIGSMKAKMNTGKLAQAALAVHLGFYEPKDEYLDSLDEEEINMAAESLPEFTHIKGETIRHDVKVGLIQVSVTELGSMYAKIKPQTISFNGVKYALQSEDKRLGEFILNNYIDERSKEIVMELQNVLTDRHCYLPRITGEKLPVIPLADLAKHFTKADLVLTRRLIIPSSSKLLDPEWNKGFYISCKPLSYEYIRIPPATMLNYLCGQLNNGEYVYSELVINICKIINACITKENGSYNYHFVTHHKTEKNKTRTTALMAYLQTCRNILYSDETRGQRLVQSLLAPKMPGINLKQINDPYVPDGVIVVLNDTIFKSLYKKAFLEYPEIDEQRNVLYSLALRNPFLWKTQLTKRIVWNAQDFDSHLRTVHGMKLSDYLSKHNKYCALIGKDTVREHHSDCDGDLLSISIPEGIEGQTLLREFELPDVLQDELDWNQSYLDREASANDDIDWNAKYTIYNIPLKGDANTRNNNYISYLSNSAIAKSAVGGATNNVWQMYMLGQLYYGLSKDKNPVVAMPFADKRPMKMTQEDVYYFDYVYTRLCEEKVVNAIKHVENGSLGFRKYTLSSFSDPAHPKAEIMEELRNEFGIPHKDGIRIIMLIMWAEHTGYLKACQSFISMHNKGKVETDPDMLAKYEDILEYTFIGSMFKSFYQISKDLESKIEETRNQSRENMASSNIVNTVEAMMEL